MGDRYLWGEIALAVNSDAELKIWDLYSFYCLVKKIYLLGYELYFWGVSVCHKKNIYKISLELI